MSGKPYVNPDTSGTSLDGMATDDDVVTSDLRLLQRGIVLQSQSAETRVDTVLQQLGEQQFDLVRCKRDPTYFERYPIRSELV